MQYTRLQYITTVMQLNKLHTTGITSNYE